MQQNQRPTCKTDAYGDKRWYVDGVCHREDGPAVEWANGARYWCIRGNLHREDGPAVTYVDGKSSWYFNGGYYVDVENWATAILKYRNKPCDPDAVQAFLLPILQKHTRNII